MTGTLSSIQTSLYANLPGPNSSAQEVAAVQIAAVQMGHEAWQQQTSSACMSHLEPRTYDS